MVVVARYKGKDGLKGYKTGKEFTLMFDTSHPGCHVREFNSLDNKRGEETLISYPTMRKFLDNWEVTK